MVTPARRVILEVPLEYSAAFSDEDIKKTGQIITWLNGDTGYETDRTQSKLARASGTNASTMNQILRGFYASPPTKYLDMALLAIANDGERSKLNVNGRLEFVETSVTRTVYSVCHRVALYQDMGVIAGRPGTGKSIGIKHYCSRNPNAILIEAHWNMTPTILLDKLVDVTGAEVKVVKRWSNGTQAQRLEAVITSLKGKDCIIIIDEADLMCPSSLETLRRINDLAQIGIVLAGEPKLHAMIGNTDGRFGRIFSRIGFWVPVIKHITEQDCRALLASSLPDHEISDELHDAFWQVCEGSARTLSKLLPNVRDFGLAQGHELTPNLVFTVAQKTLRMEKRKLA